MRGAAKDEREALQEILEDLLRATDASRTTLRLDLPDRDSGLDTVVAEALTPGVSTVRFLEGHRRVLLQNDCLVDDPAPPSELIEHYGVKAQMLAPVERVQRELDAERYKPTGR